MGSRKTGLAKMSRPDLERHAADAEAQAFGATWIIREMLRGGAEEVDDDVLAVMLAPAVSTFRFDVTEDGGSAEEGDEVYQRCTWALFSPLCAAGGYVLRITRHADGSRPSVEVQTLDHLLGVKAFRWLPVEVAALRALSSARDHAIAEDIARQSALRAPERGIPSPSSFGTGDAA